MSVIATEGQASPETAEEVTETTAAETAAPETTPTEGVDPPPPEGEATDPPPYEPNFAFKVHGEDKEFDEWVRPLVKDKESEEFYRDVMTRYHGIDHIKQDREQLREQMTGLKEVETKYNNLDQSLDILTKHAQTGNYDAFFKTLRIPESAVMNWAANRLRYAEMDPAQRAEYDRNVNAQSQAVTTSYQNQTLQQQIDQMQYQQRMTELDMHLSRPEYGAVAQQFDERMGSPGAFRQAIIDRGAYHATLKNVDIPVDQAVNEVLMMTGLQVATNTSAQTAAASAAPPAPTMPEKKPVIPNVTGSGLSVTKSVPKSLADIRKIRNARLGV